MLDSKRVINKLLQKLFGSLLVNSVLLIGLFGFLWFFYSAVVDRIFPAADTVLKSSSGFVNPLAYQTASEYNNWLVLLFTLVPFFSIIFAHHYWKTKRWFWIILGCIFLFNVVLGLVISKKIHDYLLENLRGYDKESWSIWLGWPDYFAHVWIIIFCGFGISLVAGLFYSALKEIVKASADDKDIEG